MDYVLLSDAHHFLERSIRAAFETRFIDGSLNQRFRRFGCLICLKGRVGIWQKSPLMG